MKILFTSYVFAPSLGGIETVSALLAPEFVAAGHEVKLVTKTEEEDHLERPFEVIRKPNAKTLLKLTRWCDVLFQNNISLQLAWPLVFAPRPWVIVHQTWLDHVTASSGRLVHLKKFLLRYAVNASISRPIADALPVPSIILGNPYSAETFRPWPGIERSREFIFLGRLVSDKGVDLLLEALFELKKRGLTPPLTIVGSGPEMVSLRNMADQLEIADQVEFTGSRKGEALARILNEHQVMVIPSRWSEPFGLVALEGIACGCAIVAAQTGGLPEAVGPCGITFEPGNSMALANALQMSISLPRFRDDLQRRSQIHLDRFAPSVVAGRYLRIFKQATGRYD